MEMLSCLLFLSIYCMVHLFFLTGLREEGQLSIRYHLDFSTLNIQLNSNYFTTKIFAMAWRYGALRAQNAHWPLRGHRPIGIMGSSLLSKSVLGHYI